MTQTFDTNANNDLYRGADGNLVLLSGAPAVAAACKTASRAMLGEMVLAQNNGMPNFQVIWVGVPNYAIFATYLRMTLDNVDGVEEVTDINLTKVGEVLEYQATIASVYREIFINGQL